MDLITVIQILDSALRLATPLLFACLAGLFSERSGIFDIGLEGKILTFAADIEQPRLERHCHRQPGKDEVRRIIQRIGPTISRPHSPINHDLDRLNRAFPDIKHHQS